MRRVLVVAGLSALFSLRLFPSYAQAPEEAEEGIEATLTQVKGTVYLHTDEQAEGEFIAAEEGAPLEAGDHIRTGTDGSAEVALADKSVIELGHNSDFIINSLEPKETEFHLGIGSFVAKLQKLLAGNSMTFHTPTAIAAVRGTELAVAQEDDSQPTRVGVFDEGKVAVRSQNGKEEVQIGPGQETEVQHKGPPAKARPMQALLAHRQGLFQARKNLAALPGRWKSRPLAQRLAFRSAFAKRPALRAGQLSHVRADMQKRSYNHLQQRRQQIRQRVMQKRQQRQVRSNQQGKKGQPRRPQGQKKPAPKRPGMRQQPKQKFQQIKKRR